MLTVGLTGKTGAGKGEFCRVAGKYCEVSCIDTDLTARQVVGKGEKCLEELCGYFGEQILNSDGTLNRRHLAEIAFTDEIKHEKLNEITHRYIMVKIKEWIDACKKDGKRIAFIDAPLLFESGADALCDRIVCVTADENTRRDRIMKRDGIEENDADIRLKSQKQDSFYTQRSDFILHNDGNIEEFSAECERVIKMLLDEAK